MDDDDANSWDLFAVVRSCSASHTPMAMASDNLLSSSPPLPLEIKLTEALDRHDHANKLSDLAHLAPMANYNCAQQLPTPKPSCSAATADSAASHLTFSAIQFDHPQQSQPDQKPLISQPPTSKKIKNQKKKKVVCQVAAGGVSSDVWAWRKYGQKPIKSSPYPRAYFKCSTSKGCQARKQVERSPLDPTILLITYTAEHNHPVPVHRNSLAESTRQKLPIPAFCSTQQRASSRNLDSSTPLPEKMEEEGDLGQWQGQAYREGKEVENEFLSVGEMEMIDEEDMIFFGIEVLQGQSSVDAAVRKSPEAGGSGRRMEGAADRW